MLLSLLLILSGGDFLFFKIVEHKLKYEAQSQIRQGFKDEELTLIELSNENKENIRWTEFQKEFEYKGQMYDVVKTVHKNGSIYLYCLNDKKEEAFVSAYFRDIKLRIQKITNTYQFVYIIPVIPFNFFPTTFDKYYFLQRLSFLPVSTTVLTPPPELS